MGDPKPVDVNVNVDFTGISYDSTTQQWTVPPGTPVFTVPNKTKVKAGDNVITWTLSPTAVPTGLSASFPQTAGIQFGSDWTFGTPSRQSATSYVASDNFQSSSTTDYEYTVNVVLTSLADPSLSRTFSFDPEVRNDGSGIVTIEP